MEFRSAAARQLGVEGCAMKVARGGAICGGESETRTYECDFKVGNLARVQPHSKIACFRG